MSNYQRFLSYIYAYEGDEKGKNVGFAKIEIRGADWRIEIRLKGVRSGSRAEVFAVQQEGNTVKKESLGHMEMAAGEGDFRWQGAYQGACGLLITDHLAQVYYTQWQEGPFSVQDWLGRDCEECPVCEAGDVSAAELSQETVLSGQAPREAVHRMTVQTASYQSRRWQLMQKVCPKMMPAPGFEAWEFLEIQLQDIGRLPRRVWVYGNNSFLVQGFFRHGHLLLAAREKDGEMIYRLGVPGMENETEKMLAGLFGFQEFMPGNRKRDVGFGYWCVEVSLQDD